VHWRQQQQGMLRFNCADSLDRTNAASYFVAVQARAIVCRLRFFSVEHGAPRTGLRECVSFRCLPPWLFPPVERLNSNNRENIFRLILSVVCRLWFFCCTRRPKDGATAHRNNDKAPNGKNKEISFEHDRKQEKCSCVLSVVCRVLSFSERSETTKAADN